MKGLVSRVSDFLASRRFYWIVVAFFVFEALWIAFSAVYPMAFDEDFHLGVIRIYSEQLSPFLSGQPEGGNPFGALAADPSYLYHYLMSFPYRFIALVTDDLMVQVVFLRLINVAMITAGIILFRKVLLQAGTSQLVVNVSTLIFALVPSVVLLSGQVNYDNLFILMLAWVCWLVLKITQDLKQRRIDLKVYALLAVALMLSSLVKYAFLPIGLAAVAYVVVMLASTFRGLKLWTPVKKSYAGFSKGAKYGLLALLVVSAGLFAQRYAVNMFRYGHPVPDCDKVISVESCMEYGPWGRNYRFAAEKTSVDTNPLAYTWRWLQGLHYRTFFMINGPPTHTNYPPALLPSATAVVILLSGLTALLFYWRQVFKGRPFLVFIVLMTVTYAVVLWSQNYGQFVETGQPVAINGRYFIPLLLPLAAVFGLALGIALKPFKDVKLWVAGAVMILFLQGGGVFSFILRSDANWYWPNRAVISVNEAAQNVLSKIMFIGPKHY